MKISIACIFCVALLAAFGPAEKAPQAPQTNAAMTTTGNPRTTHFRLNKNHVAIDGYDPVSYFKTGPRKGQAKFAYDYEGVTYHFANAKNRETFMANPTKYEPVWGGWCGHAMALRGEKVEINPECYKIVNGRNVLFFKTFYANALTNWEKELKTTPENTLMQKGDGFWKKILAK